MKTCALCARTTSPKNGVTTSSDAVLCHLCVSQYEGSPEYRREQHFKKAGNQNSMRAALADYIFTALKIRQVEFESSRKAVAEKEDIEKKAAEAAKPKVEAKSDTVKNGVPPAATA